MVGTGGRGHKVVGFQATFRVQVGLMRERSGIRDKVLRRVLLKDVLGWLLRGAAFRTVHSPCALVLPSVKWGVALGPLLSR